jgi:hypothetical protein
MEVIIDSLMKGSIALVGAIVGYVIAKDKYIFQRMYDKKLELITDLYTQVVRLEFELKKYVHFTGAETTRESLPKKRDALNKILVDFQAFQHKFWEVEIVLEEKVVEKINNFLAKYIEITSKLSTANISQQVGDGQYAFSAWDKSFDLVRSDLSRVKDTLKYEFKKTLKR